MGRRFGGGLAGSVASILDRFTLNLIHQMPGLNILDKGQTQGVSVGYLWASDSLMPGEEDRLEAGGFDCGVLDSSKALILSIPRG